MNIRRLGASFLTSVEVTSKRKKELFRWFIEKYYGLKTYLELWELAENDQEARLRSELNSIWFGLPDSVFNIQCAPSGWESFISLIAE